MLNLKRCILAFLVCLVSGAVAPVFAIDYQPSGDYLDCGPINPDPLDPSSFCYANAAGQRNCTKITVNDKTTCIDRCTCEYNNRVDKCDGQVCRDLQEADYRACKMQCIIDWA